WPALMSGVEGGVHVGMAPARLGWALLPLLLGILVPWADGVAPFPVRTVVPLAALVVLTHPAHLPAAVVIVILAALVAPPRARRLGIALGGLGIAALVTAFWTVPLLARLDETRALAWGRLADSLPPPAGPIVGALTVLALWSVVRARASHLPSVWLVAALPW